MNKLTLENWGGDENYHLLFDGDRNTGWTIRYSRSRDQWQIFDPRDRLHPFGYDTPAEAANVMGELYRRKASQN